MYGIQMYLCKFLQLFYFLMCEKLKPKPWLFRLPIYIEQYSSFDFFLILVSTSACE